MLNGHSKYGTGKRAVQSSLQIYLKKLNASETPNENPNQTTKMQWLICHTIFKIIQGIHKIEISAFKI